MGRKDGKKASTPLVEQTVSESAVVDDETPWWEEEFRNQCLEVAGFTCCVYLVRESTDQDVDLLSLLVSAVRSGVRRKFVLLEYDEIVRMLPDVKKLAVDPKLKAGGKAGKREQPTSYTPNGIPAQQGMLAAVAEVLRQSGELDVVSTAMVVKHALSVALKERQNTDSAEDLPPIPASPEPPNSGKVAKKDAPAKKKKTSAKPEKTAATEEDKGAEKDKSTEKEDREFGAFCETRVSSLRKRGEAQESVYKDDEPLDGPDLYVLLVGFSDPRLLRELASCSVHVEAVVRLGSERCHLQGAVTAPSAAAAENRAGQFWAQLNTQLAEDVGRLRDTALAEAVVERCRVQYAPSVAAAADQVYTAVAQELYRYLRLHSLFEKYTESVAAVSVPDASRLPAPTPLPSQSAEPSAASESLWPTEPVGSETEPSEPCLQEPVEYRRLLALLPPETVTVSLLVNALVEQVCVWTAPTFHCQQESPQEPVSGEASREPDWDELEERVSLKEEFRPRPDDTSRGPVLVYERDAMNAAFSDWADREPVLSAEHVMTQSAELQALQGRPPAQAASLWRHLAARQELQSAEGGPRSDPAAEFLLRQLLFESLYAALTLDGGGDGAPLPYPHPFLPVQSVRPDVQRLAPECGDGRLAADAAPLDSRHQLLTPQPHFAEFRVCERLDRLTMAQALESARDGRRRLAAYHFGGDDGLYLVYGHPRVRGGTLIDQWRRRTHTVVGLRDFVDHVQHWPEVRAWMCHHHGPALEATAPRRTPPSRSGSAVGAALTQPVEALPPGSGAQLPDAVFLVPGSLKHEAPLRQQRSESPHDAVAHFNPTSATKQADKKSKESRRRSSAQSSRKGSARDQRGEDGSSSPPPPLQPAAISLVQFEIRPETPDASTLQWSPSLVPPPKVFAGYSVSLGRLLDVRGCRQRQYFGDGSHVTVRRSQYVQGPAALVVSVRRGESRLTLHPGAERNELVVVLSSGVILHPQTALREPPPPQNPITSPAPPPAEEPPPSSPPQSRKSVRYRSPPEKNKKKETKKEKKTEPKRGSGKKRQPSAEEELPPPVVAEGLPDRPVADCAELPTASRRVQTVRLSCPNGLVVELQPEPFWPCPEPRLRVVQYYVGADCKRRRVRVYLSDGSLLLLHGDGQPEDEVLVLGTGGGLTTYRHSDAGLLLLGTVSGAGRRHSWAADGMTELRSLLTKTATDPVTRELYLQREDGARAVIRPGGQSVLQLPDGTRVTVSPPPRPPPPPSGAEPLPPGCADFLVAESGWVSAPSTSWLLGTQLTIDDASSTRRTLMTEHPAYARVELDQAAERCRVWLPQGLLVEADSGGFFYVRQSDGSRLQLDEELLCFSGPSCSGRRPVVHTLRLAPPGPAADTADGPPPSSLCETVDSGGAVWRVTVDGQLESLGARPEPLPNPLPLQLRRQLDQETVMTEPPQLFVLYRHGDGVQLLPSNEAEAYFECVQSTPGALLLREPHQHDAKLNVVRAFRPVGAALTERWRMPYTETTIVPRNLRCRDLQLLCSDAAPPQAGALVWGGVKPVAPLPLPPRLPSGLVCTRELLVSPPLPDQRRLAVLSAVNALRLRWRPQSGDSHQLPTVEPPPARVQHVYEPDRLLSWLTMATAVPLPPAADNPAGHRRRSRAASPDAHTRELGKILAYREMLRRRRFPAFFLTADGRQFLATLRQTPRQTPLSGWSTAARRRTLEEPPRLVPPALGEPSPPLVGSGAVSCRPPRLDLGLVRPGRPVCAQLVLCSGADSPLTFRVTPPGPPVGVRVRPERGLLPAAGQTALCVQLTPAAEVRSRSVFCLLEVVLDGGAQRLWVPVVACLAGGGAGQLLLRENGGAVANESPL